MKRLFIPRLVLQVWIRRTSSCPPAQQCPAGVGLATVQPVRSRSSAVLAASRDPASRRLSDQLENTTLLFLLSTPPPTRQPARPHAALNLLLRLFTLFISSCSFIVVALAGEPVIFVLRYGGILARSNLNSVLPDYFKSTRQRVVEEKLLLKEYMFEFFFTDGQASVWNHRTNPLRLMGVQFGHPALEQWRRRTCGGRNCLYADIHPCYPLLSSKWKSGSSGLLHD